MRATILLKSFVTGAGLSAGALAGDLNPPTGPIAPTMVTLDELAGPSIDVNSLPGSSEALHVITEPGVYHLSAPIVGESGKHGILIDDPVGPVVLNGNDMELRGVAGSLCAVKLRATPLKQMKDLVLFGWGGCGIDDDMTGAPAGQPLFSLHRRIKVLSVGQQGIRVVPTDADVELVVEASDILDTGAEGILFDDPATPPGGLPLLKYRLSHIHMDTTAGDGIHLDGAGFDSKGAISHVLVNRAGADGIVVRDDAILDGVKISYAHLTGLKGQHYVKRRSCVIENSGGFNEELVEVGEAVGCLYVNGGTGGVIVGDNNSFVGCTFEENASAIEGGANMVIRDSTVHGAVVVGSYLNVSNSIMLLDLDRPDFVPHSFGGGAHRVVGCEFGVHGTTLTNLPAVLFTGDHIQILRNRFVMTDPPAGPPTALAGRTSVCAFIKIDGVDGECSENSVMNLHPGMCGVQLTGLLVPAVQKVRRNHLSGSGMGAASGLCITASGCIVTENTFVGLGAAGSPITITGTNNYVGPIVSPGATSANCDPDRNIVVP